MNINTLEKNVIRVWGDQGKTWIQKLPEIIINLTQYWQLNDVEPIDNMSYNYVAKAQKNDNTHVVLKISCDKQLIKDEYHALKNFNTNTSIKALDIYADQNALLLEQAIPGYLLKKIYPKNVKSTIKIYAELVKALASQSCRPHGFTHVKKWCGVIDRINDKRIKSEFIDEAKRLKDFLFSSIENEYLCHGDLHLENIIRHKNEWLIIDPKGIIGEIAFEAAAFDIIEKNEWSKHDNIKTIIINRVSLLANTLEINKDRLLAWIFLRTIISAQWFIEDNDSPNERLNLASALYPAVLQILT